MYRLGRPTQTKRPKKYYLFEIITVATLVVGGLFSFYWFVVRQDGAAALRNNATPLTSKIEAADTFTEIDEPTFKLKLPGTWKETERNTDANYRTVKWDFISKSGVGRWLKVYVDTIPPDYPVTYVLPLSSDGDSLIPQGMSDHCSQFTPGARKPSNDGGYSPPSAEKIPTQWEGVGFFCDGAHPLWQRVGTSSKEGVNMVSVTGPTKGTHKYFFVFDDSFYNPDYTLFTTVLDSFRAK